MGQPPLASRMLAGAGAAIMAGYFLWWWPRALVADGYPFSAAALALSAVPLVLFLLMLGLAPAALQRALSRVSRIDLGDAGHVAAAVVLAGALFFILGAGALFSGVNSIEATLYHPGDAPLDEVDSVALGVGLAANLVLLIVPFVLYVGVVHGVGFRGALRDLGLRAEGALRALGEGVGVALLVILGIVAISVAVQAAGVEVPENERALAIARSVTLVGALAIAVVSSLSEEIFFRGFLQPRIGLVGQAVVFSLAHLSYVNVLEVVVTLLLGFVFGLMYRRSGNLWGPIAAHFAFNLIMLLAGIYGGEPAPDANETADAAAR